VSDALQVGYRAIDTAQAYFNEEGVGNAWKNSGIARDELFITTKVWISRYGEGKTMNSIDESLRKLQTEYVDLLLLHQCFGDYYGAYRDLEKALRAGKVRAIGVSNFYYDRFADLAENMDVKPTMNQIETHVFCQQRQMREICARCGTQLTAWGPFAEGKNDIFSHPVLTAIGTNHGKTAAQVALRFLLEQGVVVIPKSTHKNRMKQNLDILDFNLSSDEVERIATLDEGHGLVVNFDDVNVRMGLQNALKKYNF